MIKAVILDWAGTTVDFGCMAPVAAFKRAFAEQGVAVTSQEVREPMGMKKRDHLQIMLGMTRIAEMWQQTYGRLPQASDVDQLYHTFETALFATLADHAEVKPGVLEVVETLRATGIKIGSTTGYTRKMMATVEKIAKAQGYAPDFVVTPDEVSGKGRPAPDMIFKNLTYFEGLATHEVIKVGDTLADIKEGKNAGVRAIGIVEGSSQAGYSFAEYQQLSQAEKKQVSQRVRHDFEAAGADYVLERFTELPKLIQQLDAQALLIGEK